MIIYDKYKALNYTIEWWQKGQCLLVMFSPQDVAIYHHLADNISECREHIKMMERAFRKAFE